MKVHSSSRINSYFLITLLIFILLLTGVKIKMKSVPKTVEIEQLEGSTSLSAIQLVIEKEDFLKLKRKRDEAINLGLLEASDSDYVSAIVIFQGEEYKCQLRLKGDWTDHLQGKKWSYRIKLDDDKTILGMRKFSIHHPKTRNYINEWLWHKVNKDEGLIGLRYHFVEGFLTVVDIDDENIENFELGIYALEESFDKRTIENNRRKVGVILKLSERTFWGGYKHRVILREKTLIHHFTGVQTQLPLEKVEISAYEMNKIVADSTLNKQYVVGRGLLKSLLTNNISIYQSFDVDKLSKSVLVSNIFGSYHSFSWINQRYYYNPTTSLIELMAFDGNSGNKIPGIVFPNGMTNDKDIILKYKSKYLDSEYLDNVFSFYEKEIDSLESILSKEFGNSALINKENYYYNLDKIKSEIDTYK